MEQISLLEGFLGIKFILYRIKYYSLNLSCFFLLLDDHLISGLFISDKYFIVELLQAVNNPRVIYHKILWGHTTTYLGCSKHLYDIVGM